VLERCASQSRGNLTGLCFKTNAPSIRSSAFTGDTRLTVHYLLGTAGWCETVSGRPAVLWNPQTKRDAGFGMNAGFFGFSIARG